MITRPAESDAGQPTMDRDEAWKLAESIQVTPADGRFGRDLGMVIAQPHPSGWFISARSRRDLSDVESAQFQDFASLRVYLLLTHGPESPVWEPTPGGGWVTHAKQELDEMVQPEFVPDSVSAGWC